MFLNIVENSLIRAIVIFIIIFVIVYYVRPGISFNNDNTIKQFGIGENQTILPIWFMAIIIAIFSYYVSIFLMIFKK